jgi:hypothetical protein
MSVNMIVKVYFIAVLKTGITITIKSSKMSTGISNIMLVAKVRILKYQYYTINYSL